MKKTQEEALKTIKRLFIQARKEPSMSKHYIRMAKKIGMKTNAKIPRELKKLYCHKCFSLFNNKNSETRIKKGFRMIKCLECGNYNRIKINL